MAVTDEPVIGVEMFRKLLDEGVVKRLPVVPDTYLTITDEEHKALVERVAELTVEVERLKYRVREAEAGLDWANHLASLPADD